jgi:hypothetical protein
MSKISENRSADFSRRSLLRQLALTAGGTAMLAATMRGKRAEAATKMSQKGAGYQPTPKGPQQCDNCSQFVTPGSCKVVDGAIDPAGWCRIYAKKSA